MKTLLAFAFVYVLGIVQNGIQVASAIICYNGTASSNSKEVDMTKISASECPTDILTCMYYYGNVGNLHSWSFKCDVQSNRANNQINCQKQQIGDSTSEICYCKGNFCNKPKIEVVNSSKCYHGTFSSETVDLTRLSVKKCPADVMTCMYTYVKVDDKPSWGFSCDSVKNRPHSQIGCSETEVNDEGEARTCYCKGDLCYNLSVNCKANVALIMAVVLAMVAFSHRT